MFCPKCGAEVIDGDFCPKCGTRVSDNASGNQSDSNTGYVQSTPTQAPVSQPAQPVQAPQQKGNTSRTIGLVMAIGAIAIVAVIALIVIVKNHRVSVKLDDYLKVEFEGYDSLGQAKATFDWESFEKDYAGKIKIDKAALKKYLKSELDEDLFSDKASSAMVNEYLEEVLESGPAPIIEDYISGDFDLDKDKNLSNGDEVTVTWDISEDDIEEMESFMKCRFKYSDEGMTFPVIGLEQVGTFDPFETVEITYSGIAPNGNASLDYDSGKYGYYLNYNISKSSGLSNGDTVTVTVKMSSSEESFVEEYGVLPSPTEKTYTVDGLMEYISTAADIPDKLMSDMQSQAEDIINSMAAKNWNDEVSIKSLTYLGNYYLTNKRDDAWSELNRCCLVYKITATMDVIEDETEKEIAIDQDVYYYVTFSDLMKEEDGTGAVDISRYSTPSSSFKVDTGIKVLNTWWDNTYQYTYYGFETVDKLYNEVVTKNLETYSHEDNVVE